MSDLLGCQALGLCAGQALVVFEDGSSLVVSGLPVFFVPALIVFEGNVGNKGNSFLKPFGFKALC
ncbi:hypothetical protein KHC28_15205 [Ancylobacter sonchi]|uniref:hypothetical protein n=1 Tax=Ancylobacter sonchi TaxID=1937790 RepID=UPI001BD60638|nr:hypothetical protein [Ancylobacter sonchi]MBS7535001.1 hypothetical protein [Ancylobacter sonchi]